MKNLSLLILLFATACTSRNVSTTATDTVIIAPVSTPTVIIKTDSITVSAAGIGDFKIGMHLQSVEKLLHRTLANVPPPKEQGNGYGDARDTVRGINPDTISFNYRNAGYTLMFTQGWQEDSTYATTISRITSRSPLLKTAEGISIGDSLSKIQRVYDYNSLRFNADHLDAYARAWVGKGKSIVTVTTDTGNIIVFYMVNKKVDAMRVDARVEGD